MQEMYGEWVPVIADLSLIQSLWRDSLKRELIKEMLHRANSRRPPIAYINALVDAFCDVLDVEFEELTEPQKGKVLLKNRHIYEDRQLGDFCAASRNRALAKYQKQQSGAAEVDDFMEELEKA